MGFSILDIIDRLACSSPISKLLIMATFAFVMLFIIFIAMTIGYWEWFKYAIKRSIGHYDDVILLFFLTILLLVITVYPYIYIFKTLAHWYINL